MEKTQEVQDTSDKRVVINYFDPYFIISMMINDPYFKEKND